MGLTSEGFFKAMGTLTLAFPVEPSKDRDALYRSALADLSDGAVLAAVVEIVKADHFFPKIARIREIAERSAAREYQAVLAMPTPAERLFGEIAAVWNRERPEESLSPDAQALIDHLGGWEAIEASGPPTLPQMIRAHNESRESAREAVTA